ncbi:MAG TPA: creatininase family protein [Pyrinomonadaceae bacterium]|nr:creatininase family protein [Pyrinomonadaceae bacterium]
MNRIACLLALVLTGVSAGQINKPTTPSEERVVQASSIYIEDLTWTEVRDAIASGKTTAIIYVGSTEQKGPHMAIGEHNFVAHFVAGRIAETLGDALVFPTLPFALTGDPATKTGHMRFPGSVSLTSEVFLGVVRQIAISAIAAGFKEVYLMGDHGGGQSELKLAAESLDGDWSSKGVLVRYVPDLYIKSQEQARKYLGDHQIVVGSHAGAVDTSELMSVDVARRWIRADKLALSNSTQRASTGVDGDPTKATPEMGKIFIDFKVKAAVAQIREFRNARNRKP